MRTIKFRAWDGRKARMFYLTSLYWKDGLDGMLALRHVGYYDSEDKQEYTEDVAEFELMQFTGLKDKNGREIYEGDIITGTYLTGKLLTGRIWYDEQAAVFMVEDRYAWMWQEKEVIGNIYENPELIKG